MFPGKEEVEQGGPKASDVERPCGTGSKSNADVLIHISKIEKGCSLSFFLGSRNP
jgi:hypothetical protein